MAFKLIIELSATPVWIHFPSGIWSAYVTGDKLPPTYVCTSKYNDVLLTEGHIRRTQPSSSRQKLTLDSLSLPFSHRWRHHSMYIVYPSSYVTELLGER